MNILPASKQSEIIAALTEGVSIRATERLTGVHRDTVMRLGVRVGDGCAKLHDALMRDLRVARIELDEIWQYVGKKRDHVKETDPDTVGDQYTFLALDGTSKAILAHRTGKRDGNNTREFIADLRARVIGSPEFSTDAFRAYPFAIEQEFGWKINYGTIEKNFKVTAGNEAARRYSPGRVISVSRKAILGNPEFISTSYVERQNLTLRMSQRRFTRLTNGFSKKLENHMAAVALYVMHYNFCRVHEAHRVTPAMQLGLADHVWSIGELVEAALHGTIEGRQGKKQNRFSAIGGNAG
jgi:IS1 family transposase